MKIIISTVKYSCYGLLLAILPWLLTQWYYQSVIVPVADAAVMPTAIVFGAGLNSKNTPSAILSARIRAAAALYHAGKVKNILLSGDGLDQYHNEPAAMRALALKLGVPAHDLILDYAGNDTYHTCLNAKDIFDIEEAILVTQRFHLPRALFICSNLGVNSQGIELVTKTNTHYAWLYHHLREIFATFAAWIEVWGNRLH